MTRQAMAPGRQPGDPVQPGVPGHEITVPKSADPPYCSCGVVGGNGINRPLLADHIAEVVAAHRASGGVVNPPW